MYRHTDGIDNFVQYLRTVGACIEGIDWFLDRIKDKTNPTMLDLLGGVSVDAPGISIGWIYWLLRLERKNMDSVLRMELLKALPPTTAFRAYMNFDDLTADEEALLENSFSAGVERGVEQFRNGEIKRVKDGGKGI